MILLCLQCVFHRLVLAKYGGSFLGLSQFLLLPLTFDARYKNSQKWLEYNNLNSWNILYLTSSTLNIFYVMIFKNYKVSFAEVTCAMQNNNSGYLIFFKILSKYSFSSIFLTSQPLYPPSNSLLSYGSPKLDELRLLPMLYSLLLLQNVHAFSPFAQAIWIRIRSENVGTFNTNLLATCHVHVQFSNLSIFFSLSLFFMGWDTKDAFFRLGHFIKRTYF